MVFYQIIKGQCWKVNLIFISFKCLLNRLLNINYEHRVIYRSVFASNSEHRLGIGESAGRVIAIEQSDQGQQAILPFF